MSKNKVRVSRKEWDRIFGKADIDKAECTQLRISFDERSSIHNIGESVYQYYDKKWMENFKANVVFMCRCATYPADKSI